MTEAEWLSSNDPRAMLEFLRNKHAPSDRKLRLFVCACWELSGTDKAHSILDEIESGEASAGWQSDMDWALSWTHDFGDKVSLATRAALLRDIFGSPFRPSNLAVRWNELHEHAAGAAPRVPSWLTWNDRTISKLAQRIYDSRDFDQMPVLADALEEAGCANEEILYHCRGFRLVADEEMPNKYWLRKLDAPHVRGCWAIDCLLGKS